MSDLVARLVQIVGVDHVLDDPQLKASYETDWTGRFHGSASAVVRPATTGEVTQVVTACADAGVTVCVQGGNTGLVGASVPSEGSILLSTGRLRELGPVDDVLRKSPSARA